MSDLRDGIPTSPADTTNDDRLPQTTEPAWVRRSNEIVRPVLKLMRRFEPERLAALGFPGVADEVTRLPAGGPQERIAALDQTIRGLGERRAGEPDAEVGVDLEAMMIHLTREVDLLRAESECLLPYFNFAQMMFSSFLTLHQNLRRAAVAFLDPALHQGCLSVERAACFLQTRVGLTERSAQQTIWRTVIWSPGQATSYFYGHSQLAALRTTVECRLGAAFDRRRFHDVLMDQGLLPLSLLRRWIMQRIEPAARIGRSRDGDVSVGKLPHVWR